MGIILMAEINNALAVDETELPLAKLRYEIFIIKDGVLPDLVYR